MTDRSVLRMLVGAIIFFLFALLYTQKWFPNDGQTFQVIANLLSGFSGAFLMYIKDRLGVHDDDKKEPPK